MGIFDLTTPASEGLSQLPVWTVTAVGYVIEPGDQDSIVRYFVAAVNATTPTVAASGFVYYVAERLREEFPDAEIDDIDVISIFAGECENLIDQLTDEEDEDDETETPNCLGGMSTDPC